MASRYILGAALALLTTGSAVAEKPFTTRHKMDSRAFEKMLAECTSGPDESRRLAHLRVDLLRAINAKRWNLRQLRPNQKLDDAAQAHAEDMASGGFMSHGGSDGSNAGMRAKRFGYSYRLIMENVANGQTSVEQVVDSWMSSPGHRAAILEKDVIHLGVGFATGPHLGNRKAGMIAGCYWAMVVASPLQ